MILIKYVCFTEIGFIIKKNITTAYKNEPKPAAAEAVAAAAYGKEI